MRDDLTRDILLIVTTIGFITLALGIGGEKENNEEENADILPV